MHGPIYRYDADSPSTAKWPAYWDVKWFVGDHNRGRHGARGRPRRRHGRQRTSRRRRPWTSRASSARRPPQAMDMDVRSGRRPLRPRLRRRLLHHDGQAVAVADQLHGRPGDAERGAAGDPDRRASRSTSSRAAPAASSYEWDFGDGQTSTEANPTHTYAEAKRYTATLTVTYADGATDVEHGRRRRARRRPTRPRRPRRTRSPRPRRTGDGTYKQPVTSRSTATDARRLGVDTHGVPHQRRRLDRPTRRPSAVEQPGIYVFDFRST